MGNSLDSKKDTILNGISAGMDLEDMMVLAQCTPREMVSLKNDSLFQSQVRCSAKTLEKDLLVNLHNIINIQAEKGKDHGTIWLLSKLNPRFSDRPEMGDKPGVININIAGKSLDTMPEVEVMNYKAPTPQPPSECSLNRDDDFIPQDTEYTDSDPIDTVLLNTNLHSGGETLTPGEKY